MMTRNCQNCKAQFEITDDDLNFYSKIQVPPPTWCPECREQRRIAFRNERSLYKRKCDSCGKVVISRVSPDKPYPMYCQKCWWSDNWDPLSYGRQYDPSRSFFDQFRELIFATPHVALFNANTVNSEWVNQETDDKNCYLNVGGHYNEDSAYNTYEIYGNHCFDNYWVLNSELCYECISCERCHRALYSQECLNCINTILSYDCRNCTDIIGCAGLRNKQRYIFNQPVSKETYAEFIKNHPLTSRREVGELTREAHKIWLAVPHRSAFIVQSKNATGNFINESKNIKNSFYAEKTEDAAYLYIGGWLRDGYDLTSYGASELSYECSSGGGTYNSRVTLFCMASDPLKKVHSLNLDYCYSVVSSSNCFGCANMKNQEYCILNKKYSKEEYEALAAKIREQMNKMPYQDKKGRKYFYGDFLPIEHSPFGYNETAAQDWYPLTREAAIEGGYLWSDYQSDVKYEFSDYKIPDDIRDVKDDILDKFLKCEASGKAYRITPMELQFYRHVGIPIPLRWPLERHKARIARMLPRKLWRRKCQCAGATASNGSYKNTSQHQHGSNSCHNEFETSYAPDRKEIVYCEDCYKAEVI